MSEKSDGYGEEEPLSQITDEELCTMALAADPNAPLSPDASPWHPTDIHATALLPDWYMPAAATTHPRSFRKGIISIVVFSLLAISAAGLCTIFGFLTRA